MMKFEKNIEERKVLVKRLGELTGISPYYTKVPRCAYEIGDYTVERDGSLTVEEDAAELGILAALKNEGLIKDAEGILEAAAEQPEQAETEPIPDSEYESEVREEAAGSGRDSRPGRRGTIGFGNQPSGRGAHGSFLKKPCEHDLQQGPAP